MAKVIEQQIKDIIYSNFAKVSREGMGFLDSNMESAIKELEEAFKKTAVELITECCVEVSCEDGRLSEKDPADLVEFLQQKGLIEDSNISLKEQRLKEFVKRKCNTGSAIIEFYQGFIIIAHDEKDLRSKKSTVQTCKGLGFYTVEGMERIMDKEQL